MAKYDHELDTSGLNCPLPIIRAKKTLLSMLPGQVLHVIATDPSSVKDFEVFVQQTNVDLLESSESSGTFHFVLKKTE